MLAVWGEALSRAEPPAGPPKSRNIAPADEFSKIRAFSGSIPGPMLLYNFFENAKTDTRPTWLVETLLGKQYFIAHTAGKSQRKC